MGYESCKGDTESNKIIDFSNYTVAQKYSKAKECNLGWEGITYGADIPKEFDDVKFSS
jgi:hypothetical protein